MHVAVWGSFRVLISMHYNEKELQFWKILSKIAIIKVIPQKKSYRWFFLKLSLNVLH